MLMELGLSWAAERGLRPRSQGGRATRSNASRAKPAPDEPRRSHAVEVIPAHASAVCGLDLAALLAHGAFHAAEVHDHVVAWFGLRCGAAVRKVRGKARM